MVSACFSGQGAEGEAQLRKSCEAVKPCSQSVDSFAVPAKKYIEPSSARRLHNCHTGTSPGPLALALVLILVLVLGLVLVLVLIAAVLRDVKVGDV